VESAVTQIRHLRKSAKLIWQDTLIYDYTLRRFWILDSSVLSQTVAEKVVPGPGDRGDSTWHHEALISPGMGRKNTAPPHFAETRLDLRNKKSPGRCCQRVIAPVPQPCKRVWFYIRTSDLGYWLRVIERNLPYSII
jgi:hypothetical protein